MLEKLRRFFKLKLYTVNQLRKFVEKNVITAQQFTEITGEEY